MIDEQPGSPARIESLTVKNYRALRDVSFMPLAPLTALLGPNGSGKSTVFDVFAFLSECFSVGLRKAWDKRGRFKELRTRGSDGPLVFEFRYREPNVPVMTYHLEVNEDAKGPYVALEWLRWTRKPKGAARPFTFLSFESGKGYVITGALPEEKDTRAEEELESRELLAVSTLGQFAKHPRVSALRQFIAGWHLSYLTAASTRSIPEAGPQEHLSPTGDNLPNVIQYLKEQHPQLLEQVLSTLRRRVPRLEKVDASVLQDGRLMLQIKDAPFREPVLAKYASDGTLKMLAYLVVLHDPEPPLLVGIEEPENHLHPRLLSELAEECRTATARTQLMVTTHSPFFVNGLKPEELWVIYRDEKGHTNAKLSAKIQGVPEFIAHGAMLGDLWMENHFRVGDPFDTTPQQTAADRGPNHAR